jgi:transposase
MTSKTTNKFSHEVRELAARMVLEHEAQHPSCWATILSIAAKIGCPVTCSPECIHSDGESSGLMADG